MPVDFQETLVKLKVARNLMARGYPLTPKESALVSECLEATRECLVAATTLMAWKQSAISTGEVFAVNEGQSLEDMVEGMVEAGIVAELDHRIARRTVQLEESGR